MGATAACCLERKINVFSASGGQQIIHEVRLGRRLTARSLIFFGKDMAWPRVHAAVVVRNLDAAQRILDALSQAFLAD